MEDWSHLESYFYGRDCLRKEQKLEKASDEGKSFKNLYSEGVYHGGTPPILFTNVRGSKG